MTPEICTYCGRSDHEDGECQVMTAPDIEALSKEFCRLTGKCWHELFPYSSSDGKLVCKNCLQRFPFYFYFNPNPDFRDARQVLKVIGGGSEKKKAAFINHLIARMPKRGLSTTIDYCMYLSGLFEDTTGLMLQEAVEWMRGMK